MFCFSCLQQHAEFWNNANLFIIAISKAIGLWVQHVSLKNKYQNKNIHIITNPFSGTKKGLKVANTLMNKLKKHNITGTHDPMDIK